MVFLLEAVPVQLRSRDLDKLKIYSLVIVGFFLIAVNAQIIVVQLGRI